MSIFPAAPDSWFTRLQSIVDEMPFLMSSDDFASMPGDVFTVLRGAGKSILDGARATVEAAGVRVEAALFDSLSGRLCDRVAEQVKEWDADVIVLGTHGRRGVGRMLLGSDAEQIVRTSTVPVLLVRGTALEVDSRASVGPTEDRSTSA